MILTVLGCSGSVPGPRTPCSGYLVEHDGHRLLLDLGTGAFGALLEHAAPGAIDTVVLSHGHGDHAADLAALAYAQAAEAERAGGAGRVTPTRVIAPAGALAGMRRAGRFAVEDAAPGELTCGPFRVRLARVRHSVEAYAVRVEAGAQSLVYTGDSGPCGALAALAEGAGVLLAEAALGAARAQSRWDAPDSGPPPHHLTARQAGELAARAGAGLLVVTHVRPWDDARAALAAAAAAFPGPTTLAHPTLHLTPPTRDSHRTKRPEGARGTARPATPDAAPGDGPSRGSSCPLGARGTARPATAAAAPGDGPSRGSLCPLGARGTARPATAAPQVATAPEGRLLSRPDHRQSVAERAVPRAPGGPLRGPAAPEGQLLSRPDHRPSVAERAVPRAPSGRFAPRAAAVADRTEPRAPEGRFMREGER